MNFIKPILPITDALMQRRPITDSMIGNRILVDNMREGSTSLLPSREAVRILKDTPAALEELARNSALYEAAIARHGNPFDLPQGYQ